MQKKTTLIRFRFECAFTPESVLSLAHLLSRGVDYFIHSLKTNENYYYLFGGLGKKVCVLAYFANKWNVAVWQSSS